MSTRAAEWCWQYRAHSAMRLKAKLRSSPDAEHLRFQRFTNAGLPACTMTIDQAAVAQRRLDAAQTADFYHDRFVEDQVRDFAALLGPGAAGNGVVADIGGGCGYFARALQAHSAWQVRVLDMDPVSVASCHQQGLQAEVGDALAPQHRGDEALAAFNLMLHHLVGADDRTTRALQVRALQAWLGRAERVFVNEYIYESYLLPRLSAWLIYAITASRTLSRLAKAVARWVPSLRANTFGVGVRFRTVDDWRALFGEAGWQVAASRRGAEERVSTARRLLTIRSCRRDSFLLESKAKR